MINPKAIVCSAGFGFIMSLLTGLISGTAFFTVLFRALLFAVVFGVLCVLIQIIFNGFLDNGSTIEIDKTEEVHSAPVGSSLNIVIPEEELPKSDEDAQFFVSPVASRFQKDIEKETVGENVEKEQHVKPDVPKINPSETVVLDTQEKESPPEKDPDSSAVTAKDEEKIESVPQPQKNAASNIEQLDELPDLEGLVDDSGDFSSNEEIIEDSDFASGGASPSPSSFSSSKPDIAKSADVKDAALIAQALRTVMSNDQ